jgi:hypothetical protein
MTDRWIVGRNDADTLFPMRCVRSDRDSSPIHSQDTPKKGKAEGQQITQPQPRPLVIMVDYNIAQQWALALSPKISGALSCLFSALIIVTILHSGRHEQRTYHRLILGISVSDLSALFWLSLSTWPIPRKSGVLWAAGNATTCSVQGFMNHLGLIATFYNVSLNLYFLLVIRYGWKESRILTIEPVLHGVPLAWGFSTAIYAAAKGLFGNALLWCWIRSVYDMERWILYYGPLTCNILAMMVTSLMIYLHVRKLERKTRAYKSFRRFRTHGAEPIEATDDTAAVDRPHEIDEAYVDSPSTPHRSSAIACEKRPAILQPRDRTDSSWNKRTRAVAQRCFWFAAGFFLNWTALYVRSVTSYSCLYVTFFSFSPTASLNAHTFLLPPTRRPLG